MPSTISFNKIDYVGGLDGELAMLDKWILDGLEDELMMPESEWILDGSEHELVMLGNDWIQVR